MAPPESPFEASKLKALTFDVFGTCVDWRVPVADALRTTLSTKASSLPPTSPLRTLVEGFLSKPDSVEDFAQEWRSEYGIFCRTFVPGVTPWKDVDTHHRESLVSLLSKRGLDGLLTDKETTELSLVWHKLAPWPDSSQGIRDLNALGLVTSTLSNGNHELLRDLASHADLSFTKFQSSADFGAYKPNPKVYLGAVQALGVEPAEVAMVAAHLGDLVAAHNCGLRTIYVDRPREESIALQDPQYDQARKIVDLWVSVSEEGFVEVARRLAASGLGNEGEGSS